MWETDVDVEHSFFVYATLWTRQGCFPDEQIVAGGSKRYIPNVLLLQVCDFAMYALKCGLYDEFNTEIRIAQLRAYR